MHRTTRRFAALVATGALALGGVTVASALTTSAGAAKAPADRDHDGMPDAWEVAHHTNPKVRDSAADPDRDHLTNLAESHRGGDPHQKDTDRDGIDDGFERLVSGRMAGRDSNRNGRLDGRDDLDHDGLPDGDEDGDHVDGGEQEGPLGAIASFDATTGVLVVTTPAGDLTATVTAKTVIKVEDETGDDHGHRGGDDSVATSSHGADDEGDHHGGGDRLGTTADLVPGAVVHEVEVRDGAVRKIELTPAAAPTA